MGRISFLAALFSVLLFLISTAPSTCSGVLQMKFYNESCPLAEAIVTNITWSKVGADGTLAAKFLMLHFHDCFVQGCDASILLDTVGGEKNATQNRSLLGLFDIIDEIKSALEEKCPGTVSFADIVALAARDAVSYQFGEPMWDAYTGRRDGTVSLASEVSNKLPLSGSNFTILSKQFADNGLDVVDHVALSGAHTIGAAHCDVLWKRLYNFTGNGDTDPTLDPVYAKELMEKCPNCSTINPATIAVNMDPGSPLSFNSDYYVGLSQNRGLFHSDACLLTDPVAASYVEKFQDFSIFMAQFGESIKKMGTIGVLTTQTEGEIRKNCRVVN